MRDWLLLAALVICVQVASWIVFASQLDEHIKVIQLEVKHLQLELDIAKEHINRLEMKSDTIYINNNFYFSNKLNSKQNANN